MKAALKPSKSFEKIVRGMSAKEIILAMVNGLRKKHVQLQMNVFGIYDLKTKTCFGCAATNTICEISGIKFVDARIKTAAQRAEVINSDVRFMAHFEWAVDGLRKGSIDDYNYYAAASGFAQIESSPKANLPRLYACFTDGQLRQYEILAEAQK
jgi:hypothetical protein